MAMKQLAAHVSPKATPPTEPIPGREAEMEQNRAGGYAFSLDDWTRLTRFLILGSEGGTYYATEREVTIDNAAVVRRCMAEDGARTVRSIVEISKAGRAPKNDPAILALAMCAKLGDEKTRRAAYDALPEVCHIGTHLFAFAEAMQAFGGWSRGARRAVGSWYSREDAAYQLVKYRQRNGWTHRDLLRLSHPAPAPLLAWAAGKSAADGLPRIIEGFERAQTAEKPSDTVALIRDYGLPRECVRTEHSGDPAVLEALLDGMPITAMVRNLGNLSKAGVLAPMSAAAKLVISRLQDEDRLRKARIHPMAILLAMRTYASGHSLRGNGEWSPVQQVVDALDEAFYATIGYLKPTGKRHLLAIDISGSMQNGSVAGTPMAPFEAAGAMALITAKSEPEHYVLGVHTWPVDLRISPRQRLDSVVKDLRQHAGGGTDLTIPYTWATAQKMPFDAVLTYTDGETWDGGYHHPAQALTAYRKALGIQTRGVNLAFTATGTSVADPKDPLCLQCVGLDAAMPEVVRGFVAGEF